MGQIPDAMDRIVEDRAKRRFDPAHTVFDFSSGPQGIALRRTLQPHSGSARARLAPPLQRAGRAAKSKAVRHEEPGREGHLNRPAQAALAISGALLSLVGFVLALGGYLSPAGSAFDVLTGLVLIASGFLLSARHRAGAWTYVLVFFGSVSWSLGSIAVGSTPAHRTIGTSLLVMGPRAHQTATPIQLLDVETKGLSR